MRKRLLLLLFPLFTLLGFSQNVEVRTSAELRSVFSTTGTPGMTVFLHGGIYTGAFESFLTGTPASPIRVRSFPGEWAIIDNGGANEIALYTKGAFTWYSDFEVRNTRLDVPRAEAGINMAASNGNKLINLIIHDEGSAGCNPFWEATNSEIYGCLFYYNGRFEDPGHANGYDIYGQNNLPSTKLIEDNALSVVYGIFTLHLAGSSNAHLDGFTLRGNVFGINAYTTYDGKNPKALLGNFETGAGRNQSPVFDQNIFYRNDLWLGYNGDGVDNATLTSNIFYRSILDDFGITTYAVNSGNVFTSARDGVVVRPNKYRDQFTKKRAMVVVMNGSRVNSINITFPDAVLRAGEYYELRDVQNYFAGPVAAGAYNGSSVVVNLTNNTIARPVNVPVQRPGSSQPAHTDQEFNVFWLLGDINPLPIVLKSFNAQYVAPRVHITWETLTESQVYRFNVQRDGRVFREVPPHGVGSYAVDDTVVGGTYNYQLAEVDLDGSVTVFEGVAVTVPTTSVAPEEKPRSFGIVGVYPNPFNPGTFVDLIINKELDLRFEVYNALGQKVINSEPLHFTPGKRTMTVYLEKQPTGMYFLRVIGPETITTKLMLVK